MHLAVLVCSLFLAASGQEVDNDWIDPYDMLNYDASTKTMRKPESANYDNVPTKRREYTQDHNQVELSSCSTQVANQHKQIEELKKKITIISQQPTCNPVFKRFLTRLRKEIEKVGLPSDSSDVFYDAKIRLSSQAMREIQTLLDGEDSWRTGALDNAISQILVDLRPHDYEAWKWRFEDTFGVELDTLLKVMLGVLVIIAIICTQLWSVVSWFVQFRRLLAICFFVSIIWNWLYLYKIAFAEHQSSLAKMDGVYEKCTGMKKIEWSDSLKEWFRSTWTLQDDPCKKYYEVLMVNPILLVPPTKAIAVTITTFITEPLKHVGQGISEFLVALLKDLPITLQIPVLLTIVIAIVVCMYAFVHAVFQHGIAAPFRRPQRDPPPPRLEEPQPRLQQIDDGHNLAGGDAPQLVLRRTIEDVRLHRNQVHQRPHDRSREQQAKVAVETLRTAEPPNLKDEMDVVAQNLSPDSESEDQQGAEDELEGESASTVAADATQTKPTESKTSPSKTKPVRVDENSSKRKPLKVDENSSKRKPLRVNENVAKDKASREGATPRSQPAGRQPAQTDVHDLHTSAEDRTSSVSPPHIETVGVPVQETSTH